MFIVTWQQRDYEGEPDGDLLHYGPYFSQALAHDAVARMTADWGTLGPLPAMSVIPLCKF